MLDSTDGSSGRPRASEPETTFHVKHPPVLASTGSALGSAGSAPSEQGAFGRDTHPAGVPVRGLVGLAQDLKAEPVVEAHPGKRWSRPTSAKPSTGHRVSPRSVRWLGDHHHPADGQERRSAFGGHSRAPERPGGDQVELLRDSGCDRADFLGASPDHLDPPGPCPAGRLCRQEVGSALVGVHQDDVAFGPAREQDQPRDPSSGPQIEARPRWTDRGRTRRRRRIPGSDRSVRIPAWCPKIRVPPIARGWRRPTRRPGPSSRRSRDGAPGAPHCGRCNGPVHRCRTRTRRWLSPPAGSPRTWWVRRRRSGSRLPRSH